MEPMNETWAARQERISKVYAGKFRGEMSARGFTTASLGAAAGLAQQEVSTATAKTAKSIKAGKYFYLLAAMGMTPAEIATFLARVTEDAKAAGLFDVPDAGFTPAPRGKARSDYALAANKQRADESGPDREDAATEG